MTVCSFGSSGTRGTWESGAKDYKGGCGSEACEKPKKAGTVNFRKKKAWGSHIEYECKCLME